MRKKSEEEMISFLLYKEKVMVLCMQMPLILYQINLLSPNHFVLLSSLVYIFFGIFAIFWNAGEERVQPAASRRRKPRKPGKSIFNWFAKKNHLLNLNGTCTEKCGYEINGLFVSANEIGKGSNGTVVFEGVYKGREVAVKRLLKAHNNVALKEVQHLIASDQHPNIVRLHGVKADKDYVYLILERCICSLSYLVLQDYFGHKAIGEPYLWKTNGYPSALLIQLMRDMVYGLVHLHDLGILHQDISPKNVMITKGIDICAKLSDIGISKCLRADISSLSQNATGSRSSRWVARKQKLHKHQRRAADMFSLGRVFYFCLTRGVHQLDHDVDSGGNSMSLHLVAHVPEAVDLLSCLMDTNPRMRPKAFQVLQHPLLWNSETRLCFLRDVSDRLESEKRCSSQILISLENARQRVFGARWDKKMESELVKDICRCKFYRFRSVQHLLRVVRNKLNHYHQSPQKIQELLGSVPEEFDSYFSSRFPKLLMEVYKVIKKYCRSEKCFEKYFGVESISVV